MQLPRVCVVRLPAVPRSAGLESAAVEAPDGLVLDWTLVWAGINGSRDQAVQMALIGSAVILSPSGKACGPV